MKLETATFAAGCFWGVEELFRTQAGVKSTTVGYTGGTRERPIYKEVCSGMTGHAEAVQIQYNPSEMAYEDLLNLFWKHHDPTTLNRQGPDTGTQYRSAIFYHTPEQKIAAEKSKAIREKSERWSGKIVTEILPATTFWPAEEYHQKYLEKLREHSCRS